jgi:multicomponent Na+:H+ antiporter subunit D
MDSWLVPAPILVPLGTAFLLPVVGRFARQQRATFCILSLVATLALLSNLAGPVFSGQIIVYWMSSWTPRSGLAIGISLSIDAWGLLIAFVVTVVGLLTMVYSMAYMRRQTGQGPYYVLVMLLVTALIGFSLSGDLFNQFVWLEVFSVAAFALTGFHVERREAVEAAFKYLITNSIAAFFIAIGLTLLYMQTGALNLAQIARDFQPTPAGLVAIGLLVAGYATKAALVPWHFWLPDAHSVAPSPISALFSGALIKVGIYAVARSALTLFPFRQGSAVQMGLLMVAAITMLVGGLQMIQQQRLKRILAFSSVSQMGYIILGIGLGTPLGLAAAALHTIHHALVKSALFMGAGAVQWRTDIHALDEGGGLARQMPVTFALMGIGTLSLAGMPLLSGFASKMLLEDAAARAGFPVLTWVAVLSSVLTLAGMLRLLRRVFGPRRAPEPLPEVREAPLLFLLPMLALIAGSILVGLFPAWITNHVAAPAGDALYGRERYINAVMGAQSAVTATQPAPAPQLEAVPQPLAVRFWGVPIIVAVAGTVLAYGLLTGTTRRTLINLVVGIVHRLGATTRRWHSGLVGDYAVWNAFGTAVVLMALLLANRMGYR